MTQDRSVWQWCAAGVAFLLALIAVSADVAGIGTAASLWFSSLLECLSSAGNMPSPFATHWPGPVRFILTLLTGVATGTLLLWLLQRRRKGVAFLFSVSMVLFLIALALALHTQYGIFCDLSPLILSLAAGAIGAYAGYRAGRKYQYLQLLQCFRTRLSARQIHTIAREPERVRLDGEKRTVTTLICMLRTLPEHNTRAEPFIAHTHENLPRVTKIILGLGGMIEPGINGFTAYWNMPLDDPHHAAHACTAALSIGRMLEQSNQQSIYPPVRIGTIITNGEGVSGAFQVGKAPHYTIRSASAARGARIQAMTEIYGVPVLVCHAVRQQCGKDFAMLLIDYRTLPPEDTPVHLYALLGDAGTRASPKFRALETLHGEIFKAIAQQDWAGARTSIENCRKLSGAIPQLYDLYARRIAYYEKNPPPEGWDGCFRQPLL